MTLLPPVLSPVDLDPVELQALRLDGAVYALGGAYCLLGELETPRHRARAALAGQSPRLVAELGTAAWIWGVGDEPERPRFAVSPTARARVAPGSMGLVREVVHEADDLADLDGWRVTTPLRTALDLARADDFAETERDVVVRRLAEVGGFGLAHALASLDDRTGIPARRIAAARLRRAFALTP